MLDELHKHWDNATLDYDLEKYNFRDWAIEVIQEKFPQVIELEKIHEVLKPNEVVRLQQHVQNACSRKYFMEMFDALYHEKKIKFKKIDIKKEKNILKLVQHKDVIYNFAAIADIQESYNNPNKTFEINIMGFLKRHRFISNRLKYLT